MLHREECRRAVALGHWSGGLWAAGGMVHIVHPADSKARFPALCKLSTGRRTLMSGDIVIEHIQHTAPSYVDGCNMPHKRSICAACCNKLHRRMPTCVRGKCVVVRSVNGLYGTVHTLMHVDLRRRKSPYRTSTLGMRRRTAPYARLTQAMQGPKHASNLTHVRLRDKF